jgi:hypothetical protein
MNGVASVKQIICSAAAAVWFAVVMSCYVGLGISAVADEPAATPLDVADVAWLWPAPRKAADIQHLLTAGDLLGDNKTSLWPQPTFRETLQIAQGMRVDPAVGGSGIELTFRTLKSQFEQIRNWKVAAIRIDPSAPGTTPDQIAIFGSRPQIRLVLQPVTVTVATVQIHDVTAHLVYEFTDGFQPLVATGLPPRAVPDHAAFQSIVEDIVRLKRDLAAAGIDTNGPLGIHPAAVRDPADFTTRIRNFLRRHLKPELLRGVAFIGTRRPEPWIFFAMSRPATGELHVLPHPSLGGSLAQEMFMLRNSAPVAPIPANQMFGPSGGVSTTQVLDAKRAGTATDAIFPTATREPASRITSLDVLNIIANPRVAHFFNTDCVSCHSESAQRLQLNSTAAAPELEFSRTEEVSGVDESVLPKGRWNVRNFGWGVNLFNGPREATVTQRTANEAAESAVFINRAYLKVGSSTESGPPLVAGTPAESPDEAEVDQSIASALTLVMKIKSPQDRVALEMLIADTQSRPPGENQIAVALEDVGTVHFARFVFLNDNQLMVITAFDGEFDDYILLFTDELGPVFDAILQHIQDAPPLPVQEHPQEFLDYVRRNNLPTVGPMYSAYPGLTVQDIKRLQNDQDSLEQQHP